MKRTTRLWVGTAMSLLTAAGVASALQGGIGSSGRVVGRGALPNVALKGGATTLPNGWRVTPAGHHIALPGDMPLKMVLTPDGRYLLVNTGGAHDHSVSVIDIAKQTLVQSVGVGKDWAGLCLETGGNAVYVAGGGAPSKGFLKDVTKALSSEQLEALKKPILCLTLEDGKLTPQPSLGIAGLADKDRWVAGLASGPSGALYAVNVNTDTVYKLGGTPKAVQASVKVGYRPYAVALSRDGETLAVSNWGDQSVSLLDAGTLTEKARVVVGSHPNELVWAGDGRLFVANAGSNSVSVVQAGRVTETIKTSLDPNAPVGSTPDALALSPDGARLYVANADNNDVVVIDTTRASESRVLGFIPTGWYPSALAVSPDGGKLFIGTGKGLKFRANATAQTKITSPETVAPYDYILSCLSGGVSVVGVPDAARLAHYTRQVVANMPSSKSLSQTPAAQSVARNAFSKIKHVVYIIRENRTYDEVLGDMRTGNGDPALTLFGKNVTPNAHALADKYVLLDNLYCNGEVSEDGHPWCDAAYATDFTEKAFTNNYSGRGEPAADERLKDSPGGYLWDNCARHGVTYRAYGEASSFKSSPNTPPIFTGSKSLEGHSSYAWARLPWIGSGGAHNDIPKADIFSADLREAEKTGQWPQFMVLSLSEDHTAGLKAGAYTPSADVAANDQALGRIVQAVSHSQFWKETAIFVIEDDAQDGPDHVDAHRTVGLVISPYVKRGVVDSTHYTTASYVRTMEMILKLPPMTQYDAAATPLYNSFTASQSLSAFTPLPARVDMEARNPKTGEGATASAKLDFSAPDRVDPDALNAILWKALKPGKPMPAPVRSARLLP